MEDRKGFAKELSIAISPYAPLLMRFVRKEISADEFEGPYMSTYLSIDDFHAHDIFNVVDGFFADVDAYVGDANLLDPANGDLGSEELRDRARALLVRAGAL